MDRFSLIFAFVISIDYVCAQFCGQNEAQGCAGCEKHCSNVFAPLQCPENCPPGCACAVGYFRSTFGQCVTLAGCESKCFGKYEKYISNVSPNCGRPNCRTPFPKSCQPGLYKGCVCQKGYYRRGTVVDSYAGPCVPLQDCPGIERCGANEEYVQCRPCESSCRDPFLIKGCSVIGADCSPGCKCKAGYVRRESTPGSNCIRPFSCASADSLSKQTHVRKPESWIAPTEQRGNVAPPARKAPEPPRSNPGYIQPTNPPVYPTKPVASRYLGKPIPGRTMPPTYPTERPTIATPKPRPITIPVTFNPFGSRFQCLSPTLGCLQCDPRLGECRSELPLYDNLDSCLRACQ